MVPQIGYIRGTDSFSKKENMKRDVLIKSVLALILTMGLPFAAFSQEKKEIRSGTTHYEQGKYSDAELDFRKALEKNGSSFAGTYNLGSALYKQEKQDEAASRYAEAAEKAQDPAAKSRAYHNLGNAYVKSGKYQEAVDAYKRSLRLNPADDDTRYNLAYAQTMLREQQQQQDKNEQQQQRQQQDKQDKNEQQEQQQKDQAGSGEQKEEQGKDGKPRQQPKISKEDAERILQALKNNEQELNRKLSKKQGERVYVEKNW